METRLQELQDRFGSEERLKVDAHDLGRASFLYVCSSDHAVEISEAEEGLFIEYWDVADEASDASSVKQEYLSSTDEVFRKAIEWL
jgi:hypothetical protein